MDRGAWQATVHRVTRVSHDLATKPIYQITSNVKGLTLKKKKSAYSLGGGLVTKLCLTLVTLWTVACQASLFIGFSRQEYWSGLPFPSPGDLTDPGIEPGSPALQADSSPNELRGKPEHRNYRVAPARHN